ncbi:hypothetical protein ACLKA6_005700 [Drosophila palustris]
MREIVETLFPGSTNFQPLDPTPTPQLFLEAPTVTVDEILKAASVIRDSKAPDEEETAEHILFTCRRFSSERDELEANVGRHLTVDNMISCMLEKEEYWSAQELSGAEPTNKTLGVDTTCKTADKEQQTSPVCERPDKSQQTTVAFSAEKGKHSQPKPGSSTSKKVRNDKPVLGERLPTRLSMRSRWKSYRSETLDTQMFAGMMDDLAGDENPEKCTSCGGGMVEDAEHVVFECVRFLERRRQLESILGETLTVGNLVPHMLQSPRNWENISRFAASIMIDLRRSERERRGTES